MIIKVFHEVFGYKNEKYAYYVLCIVMSDIMLNKHYIAFNPKMKRKIKKSIWDDDNRGLIS